MLCINTPSTAQEHHRVSPCINGCTLVIGMVGLGAAGDWGSSGLAELFSDKETAMKLPRGLTFSVLGVSDNGEILFCYRDHLYPGGVLMFLYKTKCNKTEFALTFVATELQFTNVHYIYISAVKRLKYLITINRIYVIVNSKLITINRKFLSILNVPSFIFFP